MAEPQVFVHIGPHKTGSTTMQAAFDQNRERMRAQGVDYPPEVAHPMSAAMAVSSGTAIASVSGSSGHRKWEELARRTRESSARAAVLSSEFFCEADEAAIARIAEDLGGDRVRVVITVRPLARLISSQWQQFIQNRPELSYDDEQGYDGWLHAMLDAPGESTVTPRFWQRHRHDVVVQRWAAVLGPERVTVVVVDERDRESLVRSFERLLDLDSGTLTPREIAANRSLTLPEIRMLERFNEQYMRRGWSSADYTRLVRFGAVRDLQARQPGAEEPRLLTPEWAIDRSLEIGAEIAAGIAASGVVVVGDLSLLHDRSLAKDVGVNGDVVVPAAAVARFVAGLIRRIDEVPPSANLPADRVAGDLELLLRRVKRRRRDQAQASAAGAAPASAPDGLRRTDVVRELARRLRPRRG